MFNNETVNHSLLSSFNGLHYYLRMKTADVHWICLMPNKNFKIKNKRFYNTWVITTDFMHNNIDGGLTHINHYFSAPSMRRHSIHLVIYFYLEKCVRAVKVQKHVVYIRCHGLLDTVATQLNRNIRIQNKD